jgi:hypothetical protein
VAKALAVFGINDEGNKAHAKLTQRLYAAWNKALGRVTLHHDSATKVSGYHFSF